MGTIKAVFAFVVLSVLAYICCRFYFVYHTETVTGVLVTTSVHGGETLYSIETEGAEGKLEVFKNEDTIARLKINSGDIASQLIEGRRYEVRVNWFRWRVTSSFRNILSVTPQ